MSDAGNRCQYFRNCFDYAFMAGKIALEHMTPVVLLTDGFLANGAQPWLIPSMAKLPEIKLRLAKEGDDYKPYARDPETLARTWALPGTKGLEHRIGGLEKMNTPERSVMCPRIIRS